MDKELMEAIVEVAKRAGAKAEVHGVKTDDSKKCPGESIEFAIRDYI